MRGYPETPSAEEAKKRIDAIVLEEAQPGSSGFKIPTPKLPAVHMPKVNLPKMNLPKVSMPKVGMPKMPAVHMPKWPFGGGAKPAQPQTQTEAKAVVQ